MAILGDNINIGRYQTLDLALVANRSPDTYERNLTLNGNSILVTLYIKSSDPGASIEVEYYDNIEDSGADNILASHGVITGENEFYSRIVVTEIHNKFKMRAVVSGGVVEFGIRCTMVDNFPLDLKGKKDSETANLVNDTGLPLMFLDRTTGEFYFASSNGGILQVVQAGLSTLGNDGEIDLDATNWNAIPASPSSGQQTIVLQNQSDSQMKFSFVDRSGEYVGFTVEPNDFISYDITETLVIYGKSQNGTGKKVYYQVIG